MPQPPAKLKASACVYFLSGVLALGAETEKTVKPLPKSNDSKPLSSAVSPEKWQRIEKAIDRALIWLAARQASGCAFPTYPSAQPAVTSLCTIAFLSRGHQPGVGAYGQGINKAVDFVLSCQRSNGLFSYQKPGPMRGMTGAGVLCLSMAGQHETTIARSAGAWLVQHPFKSFRDSVPNRRNDRVFYSAYYCSQAMAQLGGSYWEQFLPQLVDVLLETQSADGSWPEEPYGGDAMFGNEYTTALAILSLTPPYQLLPVYQR